MTTVYIDPFRIAEISERHSRNYVEELPGTSVQPAGYKRERLDLRVADFVYMLRLLVELSTAAEELEAHP